MILEGVLLDRPARRVAVRMDQTLGQALARMQTEQVDAVIVTDHCATEGVAVLGVCSRSDADDAVGKHGAAAFAMPVGQFALRRLAVCDVKDRLREVANELEARSVEHVLVMDCEQTLGLLDASDVRLHTRPLAEGGGSRRGA